MQKLAQQNLNPGASTPLKPWSISEPPDLLAGFKARTLCDREGREEGDRVRRGRRVKYGE